MKGENIIVDSLNDVLAAELTAINQFFIHGEMCNDWGYEKLYKIFRDQSIKSMERAESYIKRILYLDGQPNMSRYFQVKVGRTVKKQFENDLKLQNDILGYLQKGINLSRENQDDGTRQLLKKIYEEEEDYIDWLESQLQLIDATGSENYLAQQLMT